MPQIRVAWLGHRHRHRPFHREQATGGFSCHPFYLPWSSPLLAWLGRRRRRRHRHRHRHLPSQREQATGRFRADFVCLPLRSASTQNLDLQSSGPEGASVALVLQSMFSTMGGSATNFRMLHVSIAGATPAFVSHTSSGTLGGSRRTPGMSSITKAEPRHLQVWAPSQPEPLEGVSSSPIFRRVASRLPIGLHQCLHPSSRVARCLSNQESNLPRAGPTTALILRTSFSTLTAPLGTRGMSATTNEGPTPALILRTSFSTVTAPPGTRGMSATTNEGHVAESPFKIEIGNAQELSNRISAHVNHMDQKVCNFQKRYAEFMRPMLACRCLIAPHDLRHPSTVFLHRQTYKILNHNPNYVSCFDVMAYDDGICDEEELKNFLEHLLHKKVYVIEDWDLTISTIETLMYDHGVKGPEDGTDVVFYKGESDACFDGKNTGSVSFMIWKGNKIIYCGVYKGVTCTSATEAEAYAVFALLSKAKELGIIKLLLCSDSKLVCKVLSGQLSIGLNHAHRNLYLMIRSMRRHFRKLIIMWKPRELMVFADDLAKASETSLSAPSFPKDAMQRWSDILQGMPLFRIERTEDTNTIVGKFVRTQLDEEYGKNTDDIFFVEVEENLKYDCLLGLKQSFTPDEMMIYINNFNHEPEIVQKLNNFFNVYSVTKVGCCNMLTSNLDGSLTKTRLVVVFDATIPKDIYYVDGAFHVILVTPGQRTSVSKKKIPELTALTFLYFKGVKFPLNDPLPQGKRR